MIPLRASRTETLATIEVNFGKSLKNENLVDFSEVYIFWTFASFKSITILIQIMVDNNPDSQSNIRIHFYQLRLIFSLIYLRLFGLIYLHLFLIPIEIEQDET